uniref:F-box domain-containing protein n=1 Tax=Aegilops tauschii TaxID=37682 RepID=M8CDE8_AEGTA
MAKEKDSGALNHSMALVRKASPARPTTLHDIPDKLLKIILLYLLTSPHWLVRAAATCHYHNHASPVNGRRLIFVPSSPVLAVNSHHFSLDFLPGGGSRSWEIVDSHHTLLLLVKKKTGRSHRCFPDLLVCEPITRRCQLIPRVEKMKYHPCIGVFLDMHGRRGAITWDGRAIDTMSSFRVVCVLYHEFTGVSGNIGTAKAVVFEEGWRRKRGWSVRQQHKPQIHLHGVESLHFIGRAAFSLFWAMEDDSSSLLAYNFRWSNEFVIVPLPDHVRGSAWRAIDINNSSSVHVVCLQGDNLRIFAARTYDSTDWELQKSLQLMEATRGLAGHKDEYFCGSTKIVSTSMSSIVFSLAEETWLFSIDFETMEVAKCTYKAHSSACVAYPCELPWLPALRACIVRCSRSGRGRCSDICIC